MKAILLLLVSIISLSSAASENGACHSVYPEKHKDEAYFYICVEDDYSLFGAQVRYAMINSDGGGRMYVAECGKTRAKSTARSTFYQFDFAHPRGTAKWLTDGEFGEMVFGDRRETYMTEVFSDKANERKYLNMLDVAVSANRCR